MQFQSAMRARWSASWSAACAAVHVEIVALDNRLFSKTRLGLEPRSINVPGFILETCLFQTSKPIHDMKRQLTRLNASNGCYCAHFKNPGPPLFQIRADRQHGSFPRSHNQSHAQPGNLVSKHWRDSLTVCRPLTGPSWTGETSGVVVLMMLIVLKMLTVTAVMMLTVERMQRKSSG